MPEISRFLGIVIAMFYRDHGPAPSHAWYGERKATMRIDEEVAEGDLPRRARAHVLEWLSLHRDELRDNWERARTRRPLQRIDPLE